MINAFLYGSTLALGLIIPLGVQNVFIFNQGATQPRLIDALPAVFTAFVCDALLILCAVLGVSMVVLTIPALRLFIFTVGILFLLYMGWMTWKTSANPVGKLEPFPARRQIGFALSVSLLNPHAFVDSIGVIGTNSLHFYGPDKWAYTGACILVSLCWFLFLSLAGFYFKKLDNSGSWVARVNKISALIMWATAGFLCLQLR
jgi:L-lysine exporter family protein LysE/ArgO